MATNIDWGPIFVACLQAEKDFQANLPLADPVPMTGVEILQAVQMLQAWLPEPTAWVQARPGAITGAIRILDAFASQGFTLASRIEPAISGFPSLLQSANSWLPTIIGFLQATQPAPQPMGGGDAPHPGRGR